MVEQLNVDLLDRTVDVDAHEMAPSHLWGDVFGEASGRIGHLLTKALKEGTKNDLYNPGIVGDDQPITAETVWSAKGTRAPGAFDFRRRLDVLDVMGIRRQLIFPSYGVVASQLTKDYSFILHGLQTNGDITISGEQLKALGRAGVDEYNEWAVRTAAIDPDRLRPVACLPQGDSVSDLVDRTSDLIRRGIRAVHMQSGVPPAGLSPAHPDLDPFWSLLTDHQIACTVHVGGDGDFLKSGAWVKAPAFALAVVESIELGLEPYSFATMHLPVTNWLVCMTLGGVFERHPTLRFGVIESSAHWFGPLAVSLDMWARDVYRKRLAPVLSMLPSEYFARNVRVTPFCEFEPIDEYLRQYPQLSSCYCYSSDYPHMEGGADSKRRFLSLLEPLGDDVVEKFFVTNGTLLLPD